MFAPVFLLQIALVNCSCLLYLNIVDQITVAECGVQATHGYATEHSVMTHLTVGQINVAGQWNGLVKHCYGAKHCNRMTGQSSTWREGLYARYHTVRCGGWRRGGMARRHQPTSVLVALASFSQHCIFMK